MLNITNITPPRVPLTDSRTGLIAREWYLFFLSLYNQTGSSTISLEDIQKGPPALTVDELTAVINQTIAFLSPRPETSELQASLENVRQELQLLPRLELGTMSQLQQDNLPWVTFDTTPEVVPATTTGTLYWNTDDNAKTLNLVMEDTGDIVQQIGEETFYRVKADSAITKGQVVMFTGTVGASGGLKAAPATGLTATQNEYIMGVAAQNIVLNSWGYITWFGEIRKVNTTGSLYGETWVDGEILYYNPSIAGGLTKTVPVAPNPKVIVAAVVHADTNGILFVRPTFGSALGATDSNVQITSLANGDLLQYNSANLRWENVPASTLPVGTATNLAGGAANRIPYQTAPSTTSFIVAPTVANTFLNWSGSAFQWSLNPLGTVTSVDVSGGTTGLTFSGGPITTSGTITMAGTLAVVNGGTGASTAAGAATNLGLGTGDSPQFAAVNIGNATDTTITRVSAGVIAVEGKNVALNGTTETLTIGSIELGAVSDTTISRSSAGVIAVEGKPVVMTTGAQTVEFAAGSNTAPSMTTTGDTNTGIYFPSADTIAFTEGGTEAMRIDSSGNLGLGVAPSAWRSDRKAFDVGSGASFYGTTYDASANITSNAFINASGNAVYKSTAEAAFYRTVSGLHQWYTAPSGTAGTAITFTERMRITSGGNVGIGTSTFGTSAATVLAIATGTAPSTGPADTIQIFSTDLSAGNTILSLRTEGTPVNANTTAATTHRIAVRINGTVYYLLANTSA